MEFTEREKRFVFESIIYLIDVPEITEGDIRRTTMNFFQNMVFTDDQLDQIESKLQARYHSSEDE